MDNLFRSFFRAAQDAIIFCDRAGIIQYCNPAAEKLYQWPTATLIGCQMDLLLIEEQQNWYEAILEKIYKGEAILPYKAQRRTRLGKILVVSVSASPIYNHEKELVGVLFIERQPNEQEKITHLAQELVNRVPDAMVLTNNDGDILLLNRQAEKLFGYKKEELLNKRLDILLSEELANIYKNQREKRRAGEIGEERELLGKKNDGTEFPVEINLSPIFFEGTKYISVAIRNITARKKGEKKFRDLLESAPDAMVILSRSGKIEMVNTQAESLFGYSREEMMQQPIEALVPSIFTHQNKLYRSQYSDQKLSEMEPGLNIFAHTKSGNMVPVEICLSPIETEKGVLVSAAIRDISTRRAIEKELRISEKRFRSLAENARDSIITLTSNGQIVTYNKISEKMFGFSSKEVIGNDLNILFIDYHPHLVLGQLAYENNEESQHSYVPYKTLTAKRRNGSHFPVEISLSEMVLENDRFFILITRDITEREKLDKLEKEFVSTVSHELRTPLTSIKGSIDLLLANKCGPVNEKVSHFLRIASKNSERLISLINEILDVDKIESGKMDCHMEDVELHLLLRQAVEMHQPFAHKFGVNLEFKEVQIPPPVYVYADPNRLTQVIANFISNAIKFSPKGESVLVSFEAKEGYIKIYVQDHGPGIPHECRDKIFHRFSQVDSSNSRTKGGTGLGLYISKLIIDKFGGKIGIQDSEKGSIFYIKLKQHNPLQLVLEL